MKHPETDDAGNHFFTLYAHFYEADIVEKIPWDSRKEPDYSTWVWIERGELLGRAGAEGFGSCNCECLHLHFEVFLKSYASRGQPGYRIDPFDIQNTKVPRGYRYFYPGIFPEETEFAGLGPNHLWRGDFPRLPNGQTWSAGSIGIEEGYIWHQDIGLSFQKTYVSQDFD